MFSRSLQPPSAVVTFGTSAPNLYSSDYTRRKHAQIVACTSDQSCHKIVQATSYEQRNLFYLGSPIGVIHEATYDPTNLIAGLYRTENLNNVVCVGTGPLGNNTLLTVDPSGVLFGNGPCGVLNWTDYSQTL
jgi:hypothetical protein